MDFKDQIRQIAERIGKLKDNLPTEEATKNALIMPFIQALGYDVFNPLEVLPEMTCDIGAKKGEKIDYAILKDNCPIILIECKHWNQNLSLYDNQLLRYFNVSKAKFGILTNGIIYRFYTDLKEPNKMDEKPFMEIDMEDLKDAQIENLKRFHKSYFNIDDILSTANELKYMGELKGVISSEFNAPSSEFVRYMSKQIYDGIVTQKVIEQFTPLVKRAISSYINDLISDRLKAAIKDGDDKERQVEASADTTASDSEEKDNPATENRIVTTETEMNGFYIVKSILRQTVQVERILFKDTIEYFSVNLDNTRKVICRFRFNNEKNLRVSFNTDDGKEERIAIDSLDGLYALSDRLIERTKKLL